MWILGAGLLTSVSRGSEERRRGHALLYYREREFSMLGGEFVFHSFPIFCVGIFGLRDLIIASTLNVHIRVLLFCVTIFALGSVHYLYFLC